MHSSHSEHTRLQELIQCIYSKTNLCPNRSKKVSVPSNAISRVIGRSGCNINAIREVSGAHIEVDKPKGQGDRNITIK